MRISFVVGLSAFMLVACSPGKTSTDNAAPGSTPIASQAKTQHASSSTAEVQEIVWDDLLPVGEFERLEALYENFFSDLEARMNQQQSLMDAAKQGDLQITEMIAEGSENDTMEQIGTFNVVEDLNGKTIRIPGYIVPLDFNADAKHDEFLLVPYFGACLHTPPPPPNQMLFVKASPAAEIPDIYEPVWLEGRLETGKYLTEMGNSAYELRLSKLEPYEY